MALSDHFQRISVPTIPPLMALNPVSMLSSRFDRTSLNEEEDGDDPEELLESPPTKSVDMPAHWDVEMMPFKDRHVPCYIARADNEKCVVGFVSGMSSSPLNWTEEIAALNAQGITVVGLGLYHTKKPEKYHKVNLKLLRAFFMDQDSPLYQSVNPDLGRVAILHSTSSPLFLNIISRDGALKKLPDTLKGAVHMNSFFDTVHSSWRFGKVANAVHMPFAIARRNHKVGVSWLERTFTGGQTHSEDDASLYGLPLYNRVIKTRTHIRRLNEDIWTGKRADISEFPQTLLLANKDQCVCNHTAKSIAQHIGMDFKFFDADHFKILQNPQAFEMLHNFVEQKGVTPHALATQRWLSGQHSEMSGGLGFPLEGITSTLDPRAGFF